MYAPGLVLEFIIEAAIGFFDIKVKYMLKGE